MGKRKDRPKQSHIEVKTDGRSYVKWLVVILAVHVLLALVYWHFTPYGASPDEVPHGRYIEHLISAKSLPVYAHGNADGYEFYQPPFYYLAAVPFYLAAKAMGVANPAVAARLLSLILGALSIWLAYAAVRKAVPKDGRIAIACAGFIALLPTHVMTSSMVSNDILMEAVFGGVLFLLADMLTSRLTWGKSALLGAVLGIGILAKMTCLALFPVVLAAYLHAWKRRGTPTRAAMGNLGLVMLVSVIVGGWWLVRNQAVYGGILGISQMNDSFAAHSPSVQKWLSQGLPPVNYLLMVLIWTFRSFWATLGGMNVLMPGWIYWTLAGLTVLAVAGARRAISDMRKDETWDSGVPAVFGFTLALVLLSFLQLNTNVFQAQGRYLYPALVPLSLVWVLGIARLFPAKHRHLGTMIAVIIPVVVQLAALAYCVLPGIPSP